MSDLIEGFNEQDFLSAFTHDASQDSVAIKAEDVIQEGGGGINYALSYFEPKIGVNYKIKFITNPKGAVITHRKVYKNLPDPTRKGKTFQYVSSGSPKTCDVLQLFFDLNTLKNAGDPLATHKLKKFLGMTNQAVCLVQILSSDDATEIGNLRMMSFSTFGQNATIANLIEEKMNPTEQMLKEGFSKEDVYNIFESSVMLISATEADFDGQKGRDFSKSKWSPKTDSAFVKYINAEEVEVTHKFSKADLVDGKLTDEAKPAFMALIQQLSVDALDIHNMFAYKAIGDPKNNDNTEKYLVDLEKKVKTIVPIIANATSLGEITSASEVGEGGKPNAFKENVPSELAGSVMSSENSVATEKIPVASAQVSDDVSNILNS